MQYPRADLMLAVVEAARIAPLLMPSGPKREALLQALEDLKADPGFTVGDVAEAVFLAGPESNHATWRQIVEGDCDQGYQVEARAALRRAGYERPAR